MSLDTIKAQAAELRFGLVAERDSLNQQIEALDQALVALGQTPLPGLAETAPPPAQNPPQAGPTCDVCGHRAKNANGLKIHKGRSHGAAPRTKPKGAAGGTPVSQVCDDCNESFPTPASLIHHRQRCPERADS